MTKRRDVCHLGLLPQPRQFSWKKQLVLLYGTQLLSHWSLCSEEDSAGSFLPQSLVCSTVHKLPAALTPDMCNPQVSTQTPSSSCLLEGTSWGRESLIVSLGSRQQVLQVWWRSSWRWNLNCFVFSNIIILNDAGKQQLHHQVVRSYENIAVSPGQPIFLNCALYISHSAAGDEFQGPLWSSEVMRKVSGKTLAWDAWQEALYDNC